MKVLLTSAGFETEAIKKEFLKMVDKKLGEIRALFIPTAAIFPDAIKVLPKCLNDLLNTGIVKENIKIYDLHKEMPEEMIKEYDVVYVCGGDCEYLLSRVNEVGFNKALDKFFDNNGVYVGVSAGSIISANNFNDNLEFINCTLHVHCDKGSNLGKIDKNGNNKIFLTNSQAIVINGNQAEIIE